MSEPTIKPFMVTMERGEVDADHTGEFVQSFKHLHAVYEGYTHDDLVVVALATFEWAGFKVDPEGAEGKAANVIVERLTGVRR